VDSETVKLKITRKSISATWKCPKCGRVNGEYLHDNPEKIALYCRGCEEHFKGELE